MTTSWLEASERPSTRAVDHLGMKVPAQAWYAELIDFATTVTYRPRYLSFYCWAWGEFLDRFATETADGIAWSSGAFNAWIKRQEWWLLVASRIDDDTQSYIGGSTLADAVLDGDPTVVDLRMDYLSARAGTLGDYRSTLRSLGLIRADDDGAEVPTRAGDALGGAFGALVEACGFAAHLEDDVQPIERLRAYGEACGLHRLAVSDSAEELQVLRERLVATRERRAQVALLLRLAEQIGTSEGAFRRAAYLGVDQDDEPLGLAPAYDAPLDKWWLYQARDMLTFGLEAMLLGAREVLRALEVEFANTMPRLIDEVVAVYAEHDGLLSFDGTATAAVEQATEQVWGPSREWVAPSAGRRFGEGPYWDDPDITWASWTTAEDGVGAGFDLALSVLLRWRTMRSSAPGQFEWPDEILPARVPLDHLLAVLDDCQTPVEIVRVFAQRFVVNRHLETAFRKLLDQPRIDSARMVVDDGRIWNTALDFRPTTTSPRIKQAYTFLIDLGLLEASGDELRRTAAGRAITAGFEAGS